MLSRQRGYFYSRFEPAAGAEEESKVMQRESRIPFLRSAIKTLTVLEMTWLSVMESGSLYFLSLLVFTSQFCPASLYTIIFSAITVAKRPCDIYDRCAAEYGACRFLYEHWLNCVSLNCLFIFTCVRPFFVLLESKWQFEGFEQSP